MDDGFLVAGPQSPAAAIALRPDLAVCFWECTPASPLHVEIAFNVPVLRFSFVLQGNSLSRASGQQEFQRKPGLVEIRHFQAGPGWLDMAPAQPHRWVDIVLRPSFLRVALDGEARHLPARLREVVEHNTCTMPCDGREMTPDQFVAASQLANCPYHDAARIMYLKSKTLELLSHMLAPRQNASGNSGFSSYEIDCLNKARTLLVRMLESPPTLKELARRVGLNETKLKRGFKALFGQTVFGYYRAYRMDHARRLLMESEASVSQVAAAIGYTNISHFSAAFKLHHGINPGSLRRSPLRPTAGPRSLS